MTDWEMDWTPGTPLVGDDMAEELVPDSVPVLVGMVMVLAVLVLMLSVPVIESVMDDEADSVFVAEAVPVMVDVIELISSRTTISASAALTVSMMLKKEFVPPRRAPPASVTLPPPPHDWDSSPAQAALQLERSGLRDRSAASSSFPQKQSPWLLAEST